MQVADRCHLFVNASQIFADAIRKSMRDICRVLGAGKITPELLSAVECIQYRGFLRRKETIAAVQLLAEDGVAIKEIVRRILGSERKDVFRRRKSSLRPWLPRLDVEGAAGC